MNIGIIDADLLDNGTRYPNLALEKISGYMKNNKNNVALLETYDNIENYDKVYISKVFEFTKIPVDLSKYKNIELGGTGFFELDSPDLPYEIEHHFPDYNLYDSYIEKQIKKGIKPQTFADYKDGSIGFITRGCFRKCPFCVNRKYDKAIKHSPIEEFLDNDRKYIYFWDDNFLAYSNWKEELQKIKVTGKYFQFRQGLDIRLITEEKAKILSEMKYYGDYIFAFDHIKDRDLIEKNLNTWKKYCKKNTKLYVLCAYDSQDELDIINTFERIKILMKHKCIPYIMRYKSWNDSDFRGMYINIARWCNQQAMFKKKSFREFCIANGEKSSTMRYMTEFEDKYLDIAKEYFDLRYEDFKLS
jgi:hypothetical protein